MRAFRLSPSIDLVATLMGEGARLAGGRWNHRGKPVVYCSSSRALAAIEYFLHADPSLAPPEMAFVTVEIPDRLVRAVDHAALPSNWRSYPGPEALKDIGTEWIQKRSSAVLKVPSAAIPEEHNLVLNVDHIDFGRIKFGPPSSFIFARHS